MKVFSVIFTFIAASIIAAVLTYHFIETRDPELPTAEVPANPAIESVMSMPAAARDIPYIEETLRRLALVEASGLFHRYVRRGVLREQVDGTPIDRGITVRAAIDAERADTLQSLRDLQSARFAQLIKLSMATGSERPYPVGRELVQVAPALWAPPYWNTPRSTSYFLFSVKVDAPKDMQWHDYPQNPEVRLLFDDGRELDMVCNIEGLLHRQPLNSCAAHGYGNLTQEVIAMANDMAAGKGHMEVRFAAKQPDEFATWQGYVNTGGTTTQEQAVARARAAACPAGGCGQRRLLPPGQTLKPEIPIVLLPVIPVGLIVALLLRFYGLSATNTVGAVGTLGLSAALLLAVVGLMAGPQYLRLLPEFLAYAAAGLFAGSMLGCAVKPVAAAIE